MGQVLHGSATTTEAVRRAILHSQASLRALPKRYGINPKTVAKWWQRTLVARPAHGPEGSALDGAVTGGRSDRCHLSPRTNAATVSPPPVTTTTWPSLRKQEQL